MLNTFSRRLILSHLIPVLLVIPLMGFAFEFLLGTHVLSSNPGSEVAGTLCAHFQSLAVPFAGVMVFGLLFGSAVAWYLARVTDRPVQKIIQNIVHLAADADTIIQPNPVGLVYIQAQNSAGRLPLVLNLYQLQTFGFTHRLGQGPDLPNYALLICPLPARVPGRDLPFFMVFIFTNVPQNITLKNTKTGSRPFPHVAGRSS